LLLERRDQLNATLSLNCSYIRRTIERQGHVKDIQEMMRHTGLATMDVYMQSFESGVWMTLNSIYEELSGIPTPGTESTPPTEAQTNREESRKAVAIGNSRAFPQERSCASGEQRAASTPVRKVVLEVATKMRQSEERRMRLSY
jgi:hypothetical protein